MTNVEKIDTNYLGDQSLKKPYIIEKLTAHEQENTAGLGIHLNVHKIMLEEVSFRWCSYKISGKETVHIVSDEKAVELHFNLSGTSKTMANGFNIDMRSKQHSIFYTNNFNGYHEITPDRSNTASFFEVKLSPVLFERLWWDDEYHLGQAFHCNVRNKANSWLGKLMNVSSSMLNLIRDMKECKYSDDLKKMYLESKLIELLLLQVDNFKKDAHLTNRSTMKNTDIDRVYAAKEYIQQHFNMPCSIIDVSQKVGINQQKLKKGFRELFGTTVFGYLCDLRMYEAHRLLLDEQMYVNEVADLVGYKHPHHFTAAFKRKFGIMPKELKK